MTIVLQDLINQTRIDLAARSHTPTKSMQVVAKRGVRLSSGKNLDPVAVHVGRRIASGQPITDDHVEAMAAYHASHDGACPTGTNDTSVEDSLWGGAPGASWSASRVAAMDVSEMAQHDAPTMLQLDQEGKGVSLEVFVRDGLGEPSVVEADKGLIWAPILRSGMLATRPGPNGEKKHEPLFFVPGLASDTRKEIGLQNLVDSFDAGAIQHVTIPLRHENEVLDNSGFIKAVKIVDSKKRPGEKVLVAAHDFRDPDVRRKVELGTIANRSCGIVYDYVNTESGVTYEQAIDHVALTNKPWVTGMTAYGDIHGEDDFSGREVVPMLLSERPSTSLADSSDQSWDGSASRFSDQEYARSCVLDRGSGTPKERYSLPVREPDGTLNTNGVHSAAGMISKIKGASLAQKKAAARKLVAAYSKLGEQPPDGLRNLVAASTNMTDIERRGISLADVQWGDEVSLNDIESQVLNQLQDFRSEDEFYPMYSVLDVTPSKALVRCNYGDPDGANDAVVIPLNVDGDQVQLADFSEWTFVEQQWVTDEDAEQDKQELGSIIGEKDLPTSMPLSEREEVVLRLSERSTNQQGGAVKPTITEALERLGLSEEQRAVIQPLLAENQTLKINLAEVTKASREDKIKTRVQELQGQKFPPGFCRRFEEIALGDDGEVAAVLNLSEGENKTGEKQYTATQIAESLIAALPRDDSGALALADRASLLTSPIADRPPLTAADQAKQEEKDNKKGPLNADEWLAEAEKVAPGVTAAMNLSTDKKES